MNKFLVERSVTETIEIEAETEEEADTIASEHPLDEWERKITDVWVDILEAEE